MFGLRTKKIYIDSRFRTSTSRSNSDFDFELNETLDLPERCVAYIDDLALPVTWYNCDDTNNKLYVRKIINGSPGGDVVVTLTEGQYNASEFANEIQSQFRASVASSFTATYSQLKGVITIKPNAVNLKFLLLTDQDLKTRLNNSWTGSYDIRNTQSFNETLRNTEGTSGTYDDNTPYVSQFIDILAGKHYLYLTSSNLGSYTAMGARGERDIVKKIMVTQNYGYNCIESASFSGDDYIDVSRQSLKTLTFKLIDAFGNVVDLNGSNFSFSIVFTILDKDV